MYLIYGSIALFVVFYAVWIVVMRHIGQSKIIQWGGGFIASCLVLIGIVFLDGQVSKEMSKENAPSSAQVIAAPPQAQQAQAEYGPTLGLSFAEVTKGFNEYGMGFNASPLSTGEPRMTATADMKKAYAILEVIGVSDNTNRATLTIVPSDDNALINLGNITCMAIFLNNTTPEWNDRSNWVATAIRKIANAKTTEETKQEIILGNKKVKIFQSKELGPIFLSVMHKDRQEPES